jgi:prepilin-type processing-associated H-X9-DG protein
MGNRRGAFTLVEMLIVVALIVMLIAMLLPALGMAKDTAKTVDCLARMRTITIAWGKFAQDNRRRCVDPYPGSGWIGNGNSLDANKAGKLPPYYSSDPTAPQCPADTSNHFRTYSMNDHLGGRWTSSHPIKHTPRRPSHTFVLLEENDPRGYNLGSWVTYTTNGAWVDYVTAFHQGQMNISFADAHVETWKWQDDRTAAIRSFWAVTPDNPDLERLQRAFISTFDPTQ